MAAHEELYFGTDSSWCCQLLILYAYIPHVLGLRGRIYQRLYLGSSHLMQASWLQCMYSVMLIKLIYRYFMVLGDHNSATFLRISHEWKTLKKLIWYTCNSILWKRVATCFTVAFYCWDIDKHKELPKTFQMCPSSSPRPSSWTVESCARAAFFWVWNFVSTVRIEYCSEIYKEARK